MVGREAFRWHHGPMFFRGRLDGSAKVVVVGQEGAQDESLSHRSFTGGTGARMQHLLRFLGLDRSYLFLNSFVYPIFGQYTDDLRKLAQDRRSPIVKPSPPDPGQGGRRRGRAAGRRGRAGGQGVDRDLDQGPRRQRRPGRLATATLGSLPDRVLVVGVVHPGGAAGGSTSAIKADFRAPSAGSATGSRPSRLAAGRPGDDPEPGGRLPVLLGGHPVSATSRSGPARGWAAAGPPATAATTSGHPAVLGRRQVQRAPAPTCTIRRPPAAATRATTTTRATCPTSRRAPPASASTPARRPAWRGCCWAASPGFDWPDFAALGVTVAPVVRGRADLSRPVPQPQPRRPRRPAIRRRHVHRRGRSPARPASASRASFAPPA